MKYEMPARIRYSETDQNGILTMFHLINYLQDVSTFHAEDVERGLTWSKDSGIAWVVASWQIIIRRFPQMGERILVKTWPHSFRGFMGDRNYSIETEDGELLVTADSQWLLMDLKNNRPARVEKGMMEIFGASDEKKLEDAFGSRKITPETETEEKEAFTVQEYHLDTNHHVNNGQYIHMTEKYLGEDVRPAHFRAEYKKQAYLGDVIIPRVSRRERGVQITLTSPEGEIYYIAEYLD